ncbi:hypothetical protein FB567DRAFT_618418 [Paraphoma chrysanthemicola]|uniref:Uncharacterized protein n=1 Tax=Paraphoma chrysanthemicola TaxID=798071 RepID=A0A8K0W0W5_9PLEO|nr:hypothetical protein FB567DRAFT_618418 [Paraphoma chrysanthemicola]
MSNCDWWQAEGCRKGEHGCPYKGYVNSEESRPTPRTGPWPTGDPPRWWYGNFNIEGFKSPQNKEGKRVYIWRWSPNEDCEQCQTGGTAPLRAPRGVSTTVQPPMESLTSSFTIYSHPCDPCRERGPFWEACNQDWPCQNCSTMGFRCKYDKERPGPSAGSQGGYGQGPGSQGGIVGIIHGGAAPHRYGGGTGYGQAGSSRQQQPGYQTQGGGYGHSHDAQRQTASGGAGHHEKHGKTSTTTAQIHHHHADKSDTSSKHDTHKPGLLSRIGTATKTKDTKTKDSTTKDSKSKDTKTADSKTKDTKTKDSKTKDTKTKDTKTKDTKTKESKTKDTTPAQAPAHAPASHTVTLPIHTAQTSHSTSHHHEKSVPKTQPAPALVVAVAKTKDSKSKSSTTKTKTSAKAMKTDKKKVKVKVKSDKEKVKEKV